MNALKRIHATLMRGVSITWKVQLAFVMLVTLVTASLVVISMNVTCMVIDAVILHHALILMEALVVPAIMGMVEMAYPALI